MTPTPWNAAPEVYDDQVALDRPRPILVSLHFIRRALRRRLPVCVLSAALGLVGAGMFMIAFPPPHLAKASLVLTYDPEVDSTRSMDTNVSLLKTRTLATRTTSRLGLTMAPEDFLKSMTVEPVGSELLLLTMTAPDDAEAVRRLSALTSTYLEFRAEQLSLQSKVVVDGLQKRIQELRADVEDLSADIEQLSAAGDSSASKLSDTVSQRASIQSRIEALQESLEDATLRNSAIVASSRVLDPPAPDAGRAKRTFALGLASGLIGGAAIGCGAVLFVAITSDRLRRRSDVASVLGVSVQVSVGRITPVAKGWRWLPPLHALDDRRSDERRRFAHTIENELLLPQRSSRLVVAAVDNADQVSFALAQAARGLAAAGRVITIIDLTERGSKGLRVAPSIFGSSAVPTVLRPRGLPSLAHRETDLLALGRWDEAESSPSPTLGDATLILADLEPAVGAAHLAAWADRVVVVVTAGRSSVEKVRTVGDQIRAAGLDLRFAALVGAERTDDSPGMAGIGRPARDDLLDESEDPELAGRFEAR